jgi:hypothetical protein
VTPGSIALLTAAAHARGKALAAELADAGCDVAITSLAELRTRAEDVRRRGRRALALRMNANDPLSVTLALARVRAELGEPSLLIHVAPHELVCGPTGLDACTEAVAARARCVVYVLDEGDSFPDAPARAWAERGVPFVGVRVGPRDRAPAVARAVLQAIEGAQRQVTTKRQ